MRIRSDWHLPEEILVDILSRLPAKSVGRFRCVSKSWRALLSQSEFIRTHLHHSKLRQQSLLLLNYSSRSLFYASLEDAHHVFDEITLSSTKLNFPHHPDSWLLFHGACDGLVLVSDKERNKFVLNPITREIREMPPSPFINIYEFFIAVGLGYDSTSDDYKIVAFGHSYTKGYQPGFTMQTIVYSLKMGSWTRAGSYGQYYVTALHHETGVFVGGCLNWLVCDKDDDFKPVIVAFNLVDEKFTEIPFPESFQRHKLRLYWCDVFGGCLCLFNYNDGDLWVMTEYGVQESWVKFMIDDLECKRPCFLNQGQVLMVKNESYVMYNLEQATLKKVAVDGISDTSNSVKGFTESFISPNGRQ